MSALDRVLRPAGPAAWSAVDLGLNSLIGVTIAPSAANGGKPRVIRCAKVAGGLGAEPLTALGKLLSSNGTSWVLPLQRGEYNMLVIAEPAVKSDEIQHSIRWTIASMVDYPTDDAYVAWMRIPTDTLMPGRQPHIYVVSARHDIVATQMSAFQAARLPLAAVDVRETAHRNIAALTARPNEGVVMLALSPRGVQLTITYKGELYLDRYIEENVFNETADDNTRNRACERIVLQVQRSLDFISRTLPFIDVNRVTLAPLPAPTPLSDALATNLPVEVEKLDLATLFDFTATPDLRDESRQAEYFVALGAALRFDTVAP